MNRLWIGIDNGPTGTIGILSDFEEPHFQKVPIRKMQDYTSSKSKQVSRLDHEAFRDLLLSYIDKGGKGVQIIAGIERPLVNSRMFNASLSGIRFLEATWIVMEELGVPIVFLPSSSWQKSLLPKGAKGTPLLKRLSLDIGNRLCPQFAKYRHPDRDGLLIAHYLREKYYV